MMKNFNTILNKNRINLVYSKENIGKFQEVMKNMESCLFVTSLSLSELLSNKSESKNVIASTNFLYDPESEDKFITTINQKLNYKTYDNDLYIIIISWLNTIELNNEIKQQEYQFINMYSNEYKLVIRNMGYPTFFKNINIILIE